MENKRNDIIFYFLPFVKIYMQSDKASSSISDIKKFGIGQATILVNDESEWNNLFPETKRPDFLSNNQGTIITAEDPAWLEENISNVVASLHFSASLSSPLISFNPTTANIPGDIFYFLKIIYVNPNPNLNQRFIIQQNSWNAVHIHLDNSKTPIYYNDILELLPENYSSKKIVLDSIFIDAFNNLFIQSETDIEAKRTLEATERFFRASFTSPLYSNGDIETIFMYSALEWMLDEAKESTKTNLKKNSASIFEQIIRDETFFLKTTNITEKIKEYIEQMSSVRGRYLHFPSSKNKSNTNTPTLIERLFYRTTLKTFIYLNLSKYFSSDYLGDIDLNTIINLFMTSNIKRETLIYCPFVHNLLFQSLFKIVKEKQSIDKVIHDNEIQEKFINIIYDILLFHRWEFMNEFQRNETKKLHNKVRKIYNTLLRLLSKFVGVSGHPNASLLKEQAQEILNLLKENDAPILLDKNWFNWNSLTPDNIILPDSAQKSLTHTLIISLLHHFAGYFDFANGFISNRYLYN